MAEFETLDGSDDWDSDFACDLIGCTLLVGLTFVDHKDELMHRRQVFGTVLSVDSHAGIVLRRGNGEEFSIAPILEAIEPASPGIYQLTDEDEVVEDPDFTALLTIRSPLRS